MALWAKIKFFWDTMLGSTGSTFTASSTATGDYNVTYLYNMLETNMWKAANTTTPMYISYDAGVGNTKQADYLILYQHNLKDLGATVTLQYSTDNFVADINDVFTPNTPPDNQLWLKEFTSPGAKRHWRLKIYGVITVAPYITLGLWGLKTELDYATAAFDPYEVNVKANVNLSAGGYVTGIHTKYSERSVNLQFDDADSTLYNKIKTWWDTSGLKNFYLAWDTTNNPNDIYLVRPDLKFSNPFATGGLYRNITLNLKGRKV